MLNSYFNKRQHLFRTLGRIETHIINLNDSIHDLKAFLANLQNRVGNLENQYSFWRGGIGAICAIGGALGMLSSILSYLISRSL